MSSEGFVDYYEVLQLSPNADVETIERVFRHLAGRYHPDNPHTGDAKRFALLLEASKVLTDRTARAAYDAGYQSLRAAQWQLLDEVVGEESPDRDLEVRSRILSLLYVQRRRDMANPGLGDLELERMLNAPREHLAFHLWYLRERGFIVRTDSGRVAITAAGVERTEDHEQWQRRDRLLPKPRDDADR